MTATKIQPVAEICSASHDDAQFGERAIKPLRDISGFEYGTPLYAGAAPAAVAGPAWDKTRDSLATLLLGLARRPFLDFDVACIALDAATEPGMPLAYMRGALAAPALEAPAAQDLPADEFRGDTPSLVRNIIALLQLDADGALVPHGVGGHARGLLSAAAARLAAAPQAPAAPTEPGRLDDGMQIRCRKCGEWATIAYNSARIVTHNKHTGKPRDERDIASDPEGRLIVAPGPLPAATVAEPAAPAGDALQELDPGLSREVYRACEDLPEGWSIRIDLENGYGGVKLIDPDGEENELPVDGWLSNAMRESIAAAQAAAKGSQS